MRWGGGGIRSYRVFFAGTTTERVHTPLHSYDPGRQQALHSGNALGAGQVPLQGRGDASHSRAQEVYLLLVKEPPSEAGCLNMQLAPHPSSSRQPNINLSFFFWAVA